MIESCRHLLALLKIFRKLPVKFVTYAHLDIRKNCKSILDTENFKRILNKDNFDFGENTVIISKSRCYRCYLDEAFSIAFQNPWDERISQI